MLGLNALRCYGCFDAQKLEAIAARIGLCTGPSRSS
jgi:hypothetical protein